MSTKKQKHEHVIEATIVCAMPYNPNDLEAAAILQKQFKGTASTLVGYVSVATRMTKRPVKDPLEIPAAMKRS